jgi:uncharacterized protein (TIGR02266 family)
MARISENPSDPFDHFRRSVDDENEPVSLVHLRRRTVERAVLDLEVSLDSESHFFAGLGGDVSEGGVFVVTYRALERAAPVLLRIALGGERLEVEGTVRWRRQASEQMSPGVGVAFGELPARARALIESFCRRRPAFYYDVESSGAP